MHPKLSETLSKYSKIILVGGGTGGHVQPIASVIQSFEGSNTPRNQHSKKPTLQASKFLWIGGKNSQEEQAARENDVDFLSIPTFKLSTTRSPKVLLYPFVLIRGILEARKILCSVMSTESGVLRTTRHLAQKKNNEDFSLRSTTLEMTQQICIFSKGGPGSVAVGIAAWLLGIPLYIHESDTIPGRSNRILGRIATRIFLGFESARKYFNPEKCETIGQILSPIFSIQLSNSPTLQHSITWKTDKKHILVICGSQGARAIFEEILKNLEEILKHHEIILILGKLNMDMRSAFEEKLQILNLESGILNLVDWISQSDLAHLIPDTNIAITRGSATTLAELTSFRESGITNHEIRLIIIPLPYSADNHQYYNALEYQKLGHILLEQKNIHLLTETLETIGQNSQPSSI